jgi:hypothetical protein
MRLFLAICFAFLLPFASKAGEIWVSLKGADSNDGTRQNPKATLNAALRQAREWRRLHDERVHGGIEIILDNGVYYLEEPVFIRPEDSGTPASPTTIRSAETGAAALSGGVEIKGWKKLATVLPQLPAKAKGKVWVADLPSVGLDAFVFRQLWINSIKATKARDKNGVQMNRILSWNKKEQTCWIPAKNLPDLSTASSLEFFIHQWWEIAILRVKSIKRVGDSALLHFHQPESRIQSEHPWPAPWISKETGNSAFYLSNAMQLLDEPGEWWLDVRNQKVYYWPLAGEDMSKSSVIAPLLENIVKIEGNIDHPVQHISFKGIKFMHSSWLRPSQQGHVPHQAGMPMTDAYKLQKPGTLEKATLENQAWIVRPQAAFTANYADDILVEDCRFEHMASTGLDFNKAVHRNTINGNVFNDIGGNALLAGVFSDEATEIHLAYHPKDEREVCDSMTISNNVINDATNEDWGAVGIGVGYARNMLIAHNDISNVSYSGISMGWGWSPLPNAMKNNRIIANRIHHYGKANYDCAGIYTLSAQPGSVISQNVVDSIYKAPYAHLPSHWFYLYTDEGSSFITVKNNWTPAVKYLKNANGPGNVWEHNGPEVSEAIKKAAGLEDRYKHLLGGISWPNLAINQQRPELVELVVPTGQTLDRAKLNQLLVSFRIDTTAVYVWQNHFVIYDHMDDLGAVAGKLRNNFPGVEVRPYYDMFYAYRKKDHCSDKALASRWTNIILTADLVADKEMQKEYLDYHTTQFEKWPQVAEGFCNAGFQELLLFKNGRQLMLVISISEGQMLDDINPKTIENNPRMVEWNKIMGKYQQGIKGTKPGETWVFLNQTQTTSK